MEFRFRTEYKDGFQIRKVIFRKSPLYCATEKYNNLSSIKISELRLIRTINYGNAIIDSKK